MKKTTIWWFLAAYTLISILGAFKGGAGAVNLAATAGVMVALIFYTRRYVAEKRQLVVKGLVGISALATVISIVVALVASKEGKLGNIVSNVGSGVCAIALVLLANNKKFDFLETCVTKKFVIILVVAALVLPSVMAMLSGIVTFIISIVLVIAFAGFLFSDLGAFMEANRSQAKVFKDTKGYEHATQYDAEKASAKYEAEKND